jgi:hypothetical protein
MSANSFSLHIGINHVDTNHYQGWDGRLKGCENDALFYHQLAQKEGCSLSRLLLNSDATNLPTSGNVLGFLDYSITELREGDSLIITYSGHGGILEDKNYDEEDFQDETWCLYDRQLLDDELFTRFSRFKKGVNIVLISDSCHSGSVSKGEDDRTTDGIDITAMGSRRVAPREQLFGAYQANRYIYEPLMKTSLVRKEEIAASVLQMGACQDDEFAMEDGENGLFTKTIMKILESTGGIGSYQELLVRTKRALTGIQKPNLVSYGFNHQQLLNLRPFGSTFNIAIDDVVVQPEFLIDTALLIIETDEAEVKIKGINNLRIIETLAGAGASAFSVHHCNCTIDEPGIYPWDHAHQQYQALKRNGCRVFSLLPVSLTGADMNQLTADPRTSLFVKLFEGKVREPRGVGRTTSAATDNTVVRMFALEAVDVLLRDKQLSHYRDMPFNKLETYLEDPENYKIFVQLLRKSIFSSDTLTASL